MKPQKSFLVYSIAAFLVIIFCLHMAEYNHHHPKFLEGSISASHSEEKKFWSFVLFLGFSSFLLGGLKDFVLLNVLASPVFTVPIVWADLNIVRYLIGKGIMQKKFLIK